MNKNTLASSEKTLDLLQTIDSTFSQINKVLRDLNSKIIKINAKTNENIDKLQPWFNFFSIPTNYKNKDLNEKSNEIIQGDKSMQFPSDKNSSYYTKEKLNDTSSDIDGQLPQLRLNRLYEQSSPKTGTINSEINTNGEEKQDNLEQIFIFIKMQQLVSLDAIYTNFSKINAEQIDSCIEQLIEKRVIGCRDSIFYVR